MSVTFSTDDYRVPEWSQLPRFTYHLQVIKDGSIIGNINLKKKQFILVGRVADLCDLCIDNPSVSRKHAIIQFKGGEDLPYLYDLGGTHGTEVNKKRLPVRAYQKLRPFDMIKFGLSSRCYVLRCPELEHEEKEHEVEAENKFQEILAERKKELSKQELKDKYIGLMDNDPYLKANNLNRKLQGSDPSRAVNGVDWGISDEYDVYSYRNESDLQLEPDILRRLPGLDQVQLNRISEFEANLFKYQEIESELNELASKEKREFGLEEKLRDKKEKLEKRFVEAVEALEKSEDWIRVNLFGQKEAKIVRKERAEKEDDTFENDEFYDRTLKNKKEKKPILIENDSQGQRQQKEGQIFTTQDFWKLQKQFRNQVQNLIALQKQTQNNHSNGHEQPQQEDDLDAYMKQNNEELQKEQMILNNQRLLESHKKIQSIKDYLIPLIGETEVRKIENEERGVMVTRYQTSEEKRNRKEQENKKKMDETLRKLEIIKEMEEDLDQEDVRIFDYYRNKKEEEEEDEEEEEERRHHRQRPAELDQQAHSHEQNRKMFPSQQQWSRDQGEKEQEQPVYDLTKYK